jgi:hypothetical protein
MFFCVSNVAFSFIRMNIIHSGLSFFALSLRREVSASSATMMFRGELTRAFVVKKLRVFTLSAAKEELSGNL